MRALPRRLPLTCVLLAAALAGCVGSQSPAAKTGPTPTPAPTAVTATAGPGGVQQVTIEAQRSRFVPPRIVAHPGTLRVTLRNLDVITHNLVVPAANTASESLRGDGTASVTFTLTTPGRYGFVCSYHQGTGMRGVIEIR